MASHGKANIQHIGKVRCAQTTGLCPCDHEGVLTPLGGLSSSSNRALERQLTLRSGHEGYSGGSVQASHLLPLAITELSCEDGANQIQGLLTIVLGRKWAYPP